MWWKEKECNEAICSTLIADLASTVDGRCLPGTPATAGTKWAPETVEATTNLILTTTEEEAEDIIDQVREEREATDHALSLLRAQRRRPQKRPLRRTRKRLRRGMTTRGKCKLISTSKRQNKVRNALFHWVQLKLLFLLHSWLHGQKIWTMNVLTPRVFF